MRIYDDFSQLIGKTPLLRLNNYIKINSLKADILAKLELFNPAGSVKDRVSKMMLDDAEKEGKINSGAVIIEPTSGNTGIGLAAVGTARGYRVVLTMPDTMSRERIQLLEAYGATVVLTDGKKGMQGAIEKAEEIAAETENSFIPAQFENPSNTKAHVLSTAPEIWEDTDGKVDIFVAGVGTGGTLTGVGRYLKEKNPLVKIIAVEPFESALLSTGAAGAHKIQGIGANFVPKVLDTELYDEVIAVKGDEAYSACREIARQEGLLVGISSGAALCAAKELAQRDENKGKTIVVLFPDAGDRYLSTGVFD